jgi:hypothetical protein
MPRRQTKSWAGLFALAVALAWAALLSVVAAGR